MTRFRDHECGVWSGLPKWWINLYEVDLANRGMFIFIAPENQSEYLYMVKYLLWTLFLGKRNVIEISTFLKAGYEVDIIFIRFMKCQLPCTNNGQALIIDKWSHTM